jgi:hypothetical protein
MAVGIEALVSTRMQMKSLIALAGMLTLAVSAMAAQKGGQ